jgi:hypothetical protein
MIAAAGKSTARVITRSNLHLWYKGRVGAGKPLFFVFRTFAFLVFVLCVFVASPFVFVDLSNLGQYIPDWL